jgi:tRNA-2-methylthio-N6-dimethylallyladenosine synthase
MLLGQTVNSYGLDLSPRLSFLGLLEKVAAIDGVERIRFMSPHPQEIRKDFVDFVATNPKMCRHVHMPLQSGSDTILKAMNRNYRRSKYLKIIEDLKSRVPDMAITTDIIVGFPGETEEDFKQTMEVLEIVQFDNIYSFAFSVRPGTPAALLKETLTQEEKLQRLQILQTKQEEIMNDRMSSWFGKTAEVLIDGYNSSVEGCLQGRTSQNYTVNLTRPLPGVSLGSTVPVRITGKARYTLLGEADL